MTTTAALTAALAADAVTGTALAGRVHAAGATALDRLRAPYLVLAEVSDVSAEDFDGGDQRTARLQLDLYHATLADGDALAREVLRVARGLGAVREGGFVDLAPSGLWRVSQDVTLTGE